MNENESLMKQKGEDRVWSEIFKGDTKELKNISTTQIGQQLILDEAINILPQMRDWIENKSSRIYRQTLIDYFVDDDTLLEKTTFTFLLLAGSIYTEHHSLKGKARILRQPKINSIRRKLFESLDFDTVWRIVEAIVDFSKYFTTEKSCQKDSQRGLNYKCSISEDIMEKLTLKAYESFYPLPMLEEPLDWSWSEENGIQGGYNHFQKELIRTSSKRVDYSRYSKAIFDSVNYIQKVSWIVNEELLTVLRRDLKYPDIKDFIKSDYPNAEQCQWEISLGENAKIKLSEEEEFKLREHRGIFLEAVELYKAEKADMESAVGKYRAIKMALDIADKYKGKIIYFPHSYDFRGRVYPLPVGLSPQGSDEVKSLLEYDEGRVLNEQGANWAWAYLASLKGDDKITFEERIVRGKQLLYADYKEADEPYQFLAHQLELQKFFIEPNYKFKGRVHLDACNSGSQFTSAITGDKAGCIATNVIPTIQEDGTHLRQDAYLLVADRATELTMSMIKVEEDVERLELLIFLRDLLLANGRKICKNPVMVSNYGGTAGGRSEILWNMFRELKVDHKWINKKNANVFSKIIGESIHGVLNGGKAFELYIHKLNNVIAKRNRPIKWTTSDGFHVVHVKNKELKPRQVSCMLPGSRRSTTILKKGFSDAVSPAKMKSAISPNYIHSLDAELLRSVALRMEAEGIFYSDWIHDSFGCHPNDVDVMLDITKDEFSKLVEREPLKELDTELRRQAGTSNTSMKALRKVKIPDLEGFDQSKGMEQVKDSNWFFS